MLQITIPESEDWDEVNEMFVNKIPSKTLSLEHSLVSISKWEAKWHKPFLAKHEKSIEEILDYIKCMTITQNVSDDVYKRLTNGNIQEIYEYINNPMTATWFTDEKKTSNTREQVTSELIYYWMVAFGIPHNFEKWHLNRLLTLIRICNIKCNPPKKMSKREIMKNNEMLNNARRIKLHSKG